MPRPCRLPFRLLALAVLAATACGGGCSTFRPASQDRGGLAAQLLAPDSWPARKTDDLQAIVDSTPSTISRLTLEPGHPGDAIDPALLRRATEPEARIVYTGVHGQGIIREIRGRRFGSSIRFVSQSLLPDRPADTRAQRWMTRDTEWWNRSLEEYGGAIKPTDPKVLAMLYEGTAIRITAPPKSVTPRGTILHMAGLGSIEYEQPLLDELSRRGWYVVRIATPRVWWFEARKFSIDSRESVPKVASELAKMIDDLVAESAYAAEGTLDYLAKRRPEIPLHPLVMVGCSAGALAAPAVVARQPERFNAAVFVGGGANLLQISQTSDLTDAGIQLRWPDNQPRGDWRNQLFDEYLKLSTLDPYRTARAIDDKPILVVDANLDSTVPAQNAWLLWDRLGRPDRYTQTLGHRVLFLTLGSQSSRIADWLDRALAKTAPAPATASH